MTEYHNGVLLLACLFQLQRFDSMQRGYLHEIHLTEEEAFLNHNFAPPCLRRDIGLLRFLHKRNLGLCHPAIVQFFPRTRHIQPYHDKQLDDHLSRCVYMRQLYRRSIFHVVLVYNRLPQEVVDITSVSKFQACLTDMAKRKCADGKPNWRHTFHLPFAYMLP